MKIGQRQALNTTFEVKTKLFESSANLKPVEGDKKTMKIWRIYGNKTWSCGVPKTKKKNIFTFGSFFGSLELPLLVNSPIFLWVPWYPMMPPSKSLWISRNFRADYGGFLNPCQVISCMRQISRMYQLTAASCGLTTVFVCFGAPWNNVEVMCLMQVTEHTGDMSYDMSIYMSCI